MGSLTVVPVVALIALLSTTAGDVVNPYVENGEALERAFETRRAVEAYDEALLVEKNKAKRAQIFARRARCFVNLDDTDAAKASLAAAIDEDPHVELDESYPPSLATMLVEVKKELDKSSIDSSGHEKAAMPAHEVVNSAPNKAGDEANDESAAAFPLFGATSAGVGVATAFVGAAVYGAGVGAVFVVDDNVAVQRDAVAWEAPLLAVQIAGLGLSMVGTLLTVGSLAFIPVEILLNANEGPQSKDMSS